MRTFPSTNVASLIAFLFFVVGTQNVTGQPDEITITPRATRTQVRAERDIALSPDGKLLLVNRPNFIGENKFTESSSVKAALLDTTTGELHWTLNGYVGDPEFSRDGQHICGLAPEMFVLLDVATGKTVSSVDHKFRYARKTYATDDPSVFYFAGDDCILRLQFASDAGDVIFRVADYERELDLWSRDQNIEDFEVDSSGNVFCSANDRLWMYDVKLNRLQWKSEVQKPCKMLMLDSERLWIQDGESARILDPTTGRRTRIHQGLGLNTDRVAQAKGARWLVTTESVEPSVKDFFLVFDVTSLELLARFRYPHASNIESLKLSFDGKTMATRDRDGRVVIWDVATQPKKN